MPVSKVLSASLKTDSSKINVVIPSESIVNSYKSDKIFNYKTDVIPSESILDKILFWIGEMIDKLFSNNGAAPFIRYGIIAALIIFLVLRLMNVKMQSLFYKNRKQSTMLMHQEELEIMETNIDEAIQKEISNNNFRTAVRLMYLKLLKTLNKKEYIHLNINKTNYDYQNEMKENSCADDFRKLSRVFEFVWYGDFKIEKEIFVNIHKDFNSIFLKLDE